MQMTNKESQQICGKKIILTEGPSGAGKSTLLQTMATLPNVGVVNRSLNQREFLIEEASHKSFFNDMVKLQMALTSEEPVIFIDRCIISQQIYDAIRRGNEVDLQPFIDEWPETLINTLERDLAFRTKNKQREIEVYYLFLVPNIEVLAQRRSIGGKTYPNAAAKEIYHYKKLSNAMLMLGHKSLRPSYNNEGDINYIYRSFSKWLEAYPHLSFEDLWRSFALCRSKE